jgi:hypothetical protein
MPLLAATAPRWFETLETHIRRRAATASVAVFHPELTGRVEFEGGRCVLVRCGGPRRDASESLLALRQLGEGGYFEVRRRPRDREQVVICATPDQQRDTACTPDERSALHAAVRDRRFRDAINIYAQACTGCPSRHACGSVGVVEDNLDRLVVLTGPGTDDSLTG